MSDDVGRVFFIDDDAGMRRVLEALVASVGLKFESYSRPGEFLERFDHAGAGCVVADVIMPEMTGIQLLRAARGRDIALPFIILTGYADVEVAVSAFRAGAFDFLKKPFSDGTFLTMVQAAIEHSRTELSLAGERREVERRLSTLSQREREVVVEMIRGDSNKEIARKLGISHRTIERHRQSALRKIGVRSVVELGTIWGSSAAARRAIAGSRSLEAEPSYWVTDAA